MPTVLENEFKYYLEHQAEMVAKYDGQYIALKGGEVLGAYEDELTAVIETKKKHKMGTFLIQKVSRGTDAYTQTFHSRVAFS